MRIYPGISVVNLAVADLASSMRFYERLGFRRSRGADKGAVALFELNNIVLALRSASERLSEDDALHGRSSPGAPRLSLAQHYPSAAAVTAALGAADRAGGRLLVKTRPLDDGGLEGAFADVDGHIWEVVYNPRYTVAVDGTLSLAP